jgi:hypothetical protein
LHAFIIAIFNQISNQNVKLIIAISGKTVYKYRYQISDCTLLLLPFLLPTWQSSKIITCIYITPIKSQNYSCFDQCNYPYVTWLMFIWLVLKMMVKHAYNTISSFSWFFTFIHTIKHLSSWKNKNSKYDVMEVYYIQL